MREVTGKAKKIAWRVVTALFLLCAWVAFPSFGCLLFLIGAALSAPIPAVRDFLSAKGLRGAVKVALAVALLIAGSLATPDELLGRGTDAQEATKGVEEAQQEDETPESADAESVPDGAEATEEERNNDAPQNDEAESSTPLDVDAIKAAILAEVPQAYQESRWFSLNVAEDWNSTVDVSFRLNQNSDDTDAAFALTRECYEYAKRVADSFGAGLARYDTDIVNDGSPVGTYVTHDGEKYSFVSDGRVTELLAPDSEPAPDEESAEESAPSPEEKVQAITKIIKSKFGGDNEASDIQISENADYPGVYDVSVEAVHTPIMASAESVMNSVNAYAQEIMETVSAECPSVQKLSIRWELRALYHNRMNEYAQKTYERVWNGDETRMTLTEETWPSAIKKLLTPPEPETAPEPEPHRVEYTYVLNTNTKKFHYQSCSSAEKIKASNRRTFTGTREEVIARGYSPCKKCNP